MIKLNKIIRDIKISKIIAVVFGFNILQILILLLSKNLDYNVISVFLIAIPLIFISFYAMLMNKIAYTLLLYWFGIQIFIINFESVTFNFFYGVHFDLMLFNNTIGIDPIAILLFIITSIEIDNVFPKKSKVDSSESEIINNKDLSNRILSINNNESIK